MKSPDRGRVALWRTGIVGASAIALTMGAVAGTAPVHAIPPTTSVAKGEANKSSLGNKLPPKKTRKLLRQTQNTIFVGKLSVDARHLSFALRTTPWRTGNLHPKAKRDRLSAMVQISKPGVNIETVGAASQLPSVRAKLQFSGAKALSVPAHIGIHRYSIKLSKSAAKSIRAVNGGRGQREALKRVRLTVIHAKDIYNKKEKWNYGLLQTEQFELSGARAAQRAEARSARPAVNERGRELRDGPVDTGAGDSKYNMDLRQIYANYTPFYVDYSTSINRCVFGQTVSTAAIRDSQGLKVPAYAIPPMNADGTPNVSISPHWHNDIAGKVVQDDAEVSGLAEDNVNALGGVAAQAAGSVLDLALDKDEAGVSALTGSALVGVGIKAAAQLATGILKFFLNNDSSCQNIKSTYSTSFAAVDVNTNSAGQPVFVGSPAKWSNGLSPASTPARSAGQMVGTLGATTSAQWWAHPVQPSQDPNASSSCVNGIPNGAGGTYVPGSIWAPQPDEGGSIYMSGGFVQVPGGTDCELPAGGYTAINGWHWGGNLYTNVLYLDNQYNTYGPSQTKLPCNADTSLTTECAGPTYQTSWASGSTTYNANNRFTLSCRVGQWQLAYPWGGSTSLTSQPSFPPGEQEVAFNKLTTDFYWAGEDVNGNEQHGKIPGDPNQYVYSDYPTDPNATIDLSDQITMGQMQAIYAELGYASAYQGSNGLPPNGAPNPLRFGCTQQGYTQQPQYSNLESTNAVWNGANPALGWYAYPALDLTSPLPPIPSG